MDFERIEQLLQSTDFHLLSAHEREWVLTHTTEAEYMAMRELHLHSAQQVRTEITPPASIKSKLDQAMGYRAYRHTPHHWRMPLYQVAAVAAVFLMIGLAFNRSNEMPARVITQRVPVTKYIDRPVEKIRYVQIAVPVAHPSLSPTQAASPIVQSEETDAPTLAYQVETNPAIVRQQEIAMNNLQRALTEKSGISMGSDTVLQKMMVTVY